MSKTFEGNFFDGRTPRAWTAVAEINDDGLHLRGEGVDVSCPLMDVGVSDRLAHIPRCLQLPARQRFETPDNDAVDAALAQQQQGRLAALLHWLETRSLLAAVATGLIVAGMAATIFFGLPAFARRAAAVVPTDIEAQAGRVALSGFNRFLHPSQLDEDSRARAETQLQRLIKARPPRVSPRLIFRSLGAPNAFALPGGIIIVTDELVRLASDDELAAVLAHELGHVEKRHAIQSTFRNSAALLVVSSVTGDLSTLTSFSSTLPFMLLRNGYSHEFELEADACAVETLRDAGINPSNLATILEKLQSSRPATGLDFSYLNTHPSTKERIQAIRNAH